MKAWKPFWIYQTVLIGICIGILLCPLLILAVLPMLLFLVPVWLAAAYLIGNSVQQRSGLNKISKRMIASSFCSLLTISIFPVVFWIYDSVKWNALYLDSFLNNFKEKPLWVFFGIHFLLFWIGEETGNVERREV